VLSSTKCTYWCLTLIPAGFTQAMLLSVITLLSRLYARTYYQRRTIFEERRNCNVGYISRDVKPAGTQHNGGPTYLWHGSLQGGSQVYHSECTDDCGTRAQTGDRRIAKVAIVRQHSTHSDADRQAVCHSAVPCWRRQADTIAHTGRHARQRRGQLIAQTPSRRHPMSFSTLPCSSRLLSVYMHTNY